MASSNTDIIPYSLPRSSSDSMHQFAYEVFLSFRGEDTRYGFTDHLYQALISNGIHTFRDDNELERGGVIASELRKAIEESKIFVIILSPNYANSRWCLDELVEMSELQRLILPIFYHVDPSDVRKHKGGYEDAFFDHEKQAGEENREKIQKWRGALMKVGNLAGYDLQKYGHETRLIKEIINDIIKRLNSKFLDLEEIMVGMTSHLEELKSLIKIESNDVRVIGIYGLGGIGKTTISKVVYNGISYLFESSIFLADVRERSQYYEGRLQLQKELLNGVIKGNNMEINSIEEGISVIKQRLCSKKVLLILDDVSQSDQLEFLARKLAWFGPSSRIIITTRDQHLLKKYEVHASYEVKGLDYTKSVQLFCQHAFKQNVPEKDYAKLSNEVVNYANGLPLALKVLGSFLSHRSVPEWESTLRRLKTRPNIEVQNVLKISFEGLDEIEKETFLDIACFFKGCNKNDVTRLIEYAEISIPVLCEKSLITTSYGNTIEMHDLVQEMGKEIVRHKHPKEPGKWSRLWDPEDISLVLRKNTGTEAIEGIFLDMSRSSKDMKFTTEAFSRMKGLRFFKVHWSIRRFTNYMEREYPKLLVHEDFEFPSYDLRYLHWERYPLECLPFNFDGEELIELNLEYSSIKYLWQREKLREKLQVLNLSTSQQLTYMPCLGNMPNLEKVNIVSCGSLEKVDPSIGFLKNLTSLDLKRCQKIKKLPRTIQGLVALQRLNLYGCGNLRSLPSSIWKLKSLRYLDISFCSKLKTFPEISDNMDRLESLDLSGTGIKELPQSIEYLKNLTHLSMKWCTYLESLPKNICRLKYLETLNLSNCQSLESFPDIMECMECLTGLILYNSGIEGLPSSIRFLNNDCGIYLDECKNLRSLPSNSTICKLISVDTHSAWLNLSGCSSLESFPEITEDMECLELDLDSDTKCIYDLNTLWLERCENLKSLPASICRLKSLESLYLSGCSNLESFPEIMEDMEFLEILDLSGTGIKELPSSIGNLDNLTSLVLNHCKMLKEIPELPSRLRILDVHDCPRLGTLSNPSSLLYPSLLKWFKKVELRKEPMDSWQFLFEWRMINLGSNGIPWWVQSQEKGSQMRIELPMNWYQYDHFLGFGIFCHHDQHRRYYSYSIRLCLTFAEQYPFRYSLDLPYCDYRGRDACESDGVLWLLYYPKIAISDEFQSNQYVLFRAEGDFSSYGVHLIYSLEHYRNHISSLDFSEDNRPYARVAQ